VLACTYALLGLGVTLIYGAMRIINLAAGQFLMIGAYTAFWLFTLLGVNPLLSVAITAIIGAFLGIVVHFAMFRPAIRKAENVSVIEGNSVVLTFALAIVLEGAAAMAWQPIPRVYRPLADVYNFYNLSLPESYLAICSVTLVVCCAVYLFLRKGRWGRAIRYAIQDNTAAGLVGVDQQRVFLLCSVLAISIACMTGVYYGLLYQVLPFIGTDYTLVAWVVVVIGGAGSMTGAIVGGVIIGLLETVGVYLTSSSLRISITYLVLVIILLLRPKGLFRA
jgi:branched-chain amino acid transport system permease protein